MITNKEAGIVDIWYLRLALPSNEFFVTAFTHLNLLLIGTSKLPTIGSVQHWLTRSMYPSIFRDEFSKKNGLLGLSIGCNRTNRPT